MASCIAHAVTGLTAAYVCSRQRRPARFWVLSAVCPALPDLDAIGHYLSVSYDSFWGHRGITHSLFFAFLLSLAVVSLFLRDTRCLSGPWRLLVTYFFLITATHGILDMFTNGGRGVALFSPADTTRYFAPWRPIQVAPLYPGDLLGGWGQQVAASEALWIGLPCLAVALGVFAIRRTLEKAHA